MRFHYKDQRVHGDSETMAVCSETHTAQNASKFREQNGYFDSFQVFTELLLTRRSSYFGCLRRAADDQLSGECHRVLGDWFWYK